MNRKNQEQDQQKREKHYCSVCGREIDEEDCGDHDGMCFGCWDEQLTKDLENK